MQYAICAHNSDLGRNCGYISYLLVFSGLLLKFVMNTKGIYFRALHSFTLRQLHSNRHTMVIFDYTVACLMLFLTICVPSAGLARMRRQNGKWKRMSRKILRSYSAGEDVETKIQEAGADLALLEAPTTIRIYEKRTDDGNNTLSAS